MDTLHEKGWRTIFDAFVIAHDLYNSAPIG
jgi:hypothetical protein